MNYVTNSLDEVDELCTSPKVMGPMFGELIGELPASELIAYRCCWWKLFDKQYWTNGDRQNNMMK